MIENLVKTTEARRQLGIGATRMSAVKRAMGITSRYVLVSKIRVWLRAHPDFKERDVYERRQPSLNGG